jgi:hypothetical protein
MTKTEALLTLAPMKKYAGAFTVKNNEKRQTGTPLARAADDHVLMRRVIAAAGEEVNLRDANAQGRALLTKALTTLAVAGGRADAGVPLRPDELDREVDLFQTEVTELDLLARAEREEATLAAAVSGTEGRQKLTTLESSTHPLAVQALDFARARVAECERALERVEVEIKDLRLSIADAEAKLPAARQATAEIRAAVTAQLNAEREEAAAKAAADAAELERAREIGAELQRTDAQRAAEDAERQRAEEDARVAELRARGRDAIATRRDVPRLHANC